jgi:hypothetical protein
LTDLNTDEKKVKVNQYINTLLIHKLKKLAVVAVTLYIYILEVLGLSLGWDIRYSEIYCYFPQYLQ